MLVRIEKKYSRAICLNFLKGASFPAAVLLGCMLVTDTAFSQNNNSSQTNKQKAAIVVPSDKVDDSLSLIEGKVTIIYDGDTIGIEAKDYKFYSIRIHGIDAPEGTQGYGKESRKKLVDLVEGKDVRIVVVKKGEFDRYVGTVYVNGSDVGLTQIKNGNAWHYKQTGYEQTSEDRKKYSAAEKKARTDKLGLWSANAPIPPWEFRGEIDPKIVDNKVAAGMSVTAKKTDAASKTKEATQNKQSEGVLDNETGRVYILGPRGGCYYVSESGRKVYVKDKGLCEKPQ